MDSGRKNFLFIIGTAKAGTTSLANWLGQRDDMVLGREKEPRFFGDFREQKWQGPATDRFLKTIPRDFDNYLENFAHKPNAQWLIDASVDYLWNEPAREAIIRFSKEFPCKVICLVRDPVDRAISEYSMTRRMFIEKSSFSRSLELEESRRRKLWHPLFYHLRRSQVASDIKAYKETLGDDFMIIDFADLSSPKETLKRISSFVGGDEKLPAVDKPEVKNISARLRSPVLDFFDSRKKLKSQIGCLLPKQVRAQLRTSIRDYGPKTHTVREHEINIARDLLKAEVERCVSCPNIPTASWLVSTRIEDA